MGNQARHGDEFLDGDRGFGGHGSTRTQGDGPLEVIVWVLSGPQVGGDGMGHMNELTPSQKERWMVSEPRAPQVGCRCGVHVLQRADELWMVYWVRRTPRGTQHQSNGRKKEVSGVGR